METNDRDLILVRTVKATPAQVYAAYTTPELITQWWAPKPYETPEAEIDARPGGAFRTKMVGPEGDVHDNTGVILEAIPGERFVFTDFFSPGWAPNEESFITAVITFKEVPEGTEITSLVRHRTLEDKERHEAMGFYYGWGMAQDQLAALLGANS